MRDETPSIAATPEGQAAGTAGSIDASPSETAHGETASASSGPDTDAASSGHPGDGPPASTLARREGSRRAGFGSLLGASLLGGVIGAGLGLAGEHAWRQHAGDPVEARLAQIEQRTGSAPSRDAVGALGSRVTAAEAAAKDAADRAREAQSAAAAATARAEAASNRPAPETPDTTAVEQLTSRLSSLETEVRSGVEARKSGLDTLERRVSDQDARLGALDAKLAEAAKTDAARDEGLQGRIADADRREQDQDARVAALAQEAQQRTAALTQSVDQRLAALAQESQQRVAALTQSVEGRLADLAQAVAQRRDRDEVRATARLAVAERIGRALRDGEPYAPALASLRGLGSQGDALAALEPFAADGAPKTADLAREFRPIADRLRAEGRPGADAAGSASWEDRLRRLASAVVTVRPAEGDGRGGSPSADPVAAVASALERGDVRAASKAWGAIPESARQSASGFGTRLQQRAAAEDAIDGISRDTLAALDASTQ